MCVSQLLASLLQVPDRCFLMADATLRADTQVAWQALVDSLVGTARNDCLPLSAPLSDLPAATPAPAAASHGVSVAKATVAHAAGAGTAVTAGRAVSGRLTAVAAVTTTATTATAGGVSGGGGRSRGSSSSSGGGGIGRNSARALMESGRGTIHREWVGRTL